MKCPNTSHPDWKRIVEKYDERTAYAAYLNNNYQIPTAKEFKAIEDSYTPKETTESKKKITDAEQRAERINKSVRESIENQLTKMGVGIGVLSEFEQSQGIDGVEVHGVFDPSASKKNAEGLVELIRLAKGEEGRNALPEEFAHLVDSVLRSNGNPLYDRLTNLLRDPGIVEAILEESEKGSYKMYSELYNSNKDDLAAEARAKLIAKHILRNEEIKQSPWASLLRRVKSLFQRLFQKGDASELQKQLNEINKEYGTFTAELLGGEVELSFNFKSIENDRLLYRATTKVNKEKAKAERALRKIIETEHKRVKILDETGKLTEEELRVEDQRIRELEGLKNRKEYEKGIFDFMGRALEDLGNLMEEVPNISQDVSDIRTSASFLRDLKGLVNAYKPLVISLIEYVGTPEYRESDIELESSLSDLSMLIQKAENEYNQAARPLFLKFLRQFTSDLEGRTIRNQVVNEEFLDNMLLESQKDIGFFDRWLISMVESSDLMLRLLETPVKNARFLARSKANETVRQIQKAQEVLEAAGHTTEFLYELDDKGVPTGRYIQELNWTEYNKRKDKFEKELLVKNKNSKDASYWKAYWQWMNENTVEVDGKRLPSKAKYANKAYQNLTPAQKTYYDYMIGLKEKLDKLLPDNKIDKYLMPQTRKDYLERMKKAGSIREAWNLAKSGVKDSWVERETDDEFGNRLSLQDFNQTQLETIPVYYSKKLDDMRQLSTDAGSSMIMYADMAYNFEAMHGIVEIMEIGRDIMSQRKIGETIGNSPLVERINRKGRDIENKIVKRQGSSRFMDKVDDFYSAQLYGKYQKDQGTFDILGTKISVAKLASNINQLTALNTYALNLLSATGNVTIGKSMTRIEAISGEYFNMKELLLADKIYTQNVFSVIGELHKSRKTSKLGLMGIKYNVMQDYESSIRSLELNRKNFFSRNVNLGAAFFMNNAGEHFMQNRIFLAIAARYKLKDVNGNQINLWDANHVVRGKDGIERVAIRPGITKLDGTAFTEADVERISRRSARLNQKIQGIYNTEDMNAFQRLAQGRLAMMFRKWMPPSFTRRFQGEEYSFDLGDVEHGYYNSFYNDFIKNLWTDLKNHELDIKMRWDSMTPKQRANSMRVFTEIGQFIGTILAYMVLSGVWDDDDEWYKHYVLYTLRRLQSEQGTQVPGPWMVTEGFKLVQSPAPGFHYTENVFRALNLFNWFGEPIQTGDYKGWNKGARHLWKAMPFIKTIEGATDPKTKTQFYNN